MNPHLVFLFDCKIFLFIQCSVHKESIICFYWTSKPCTVYNSVQCTVRTEYWVSTGPSRELRYGRTQWRREAFIGGWIGGGGGGPITEALQRSRQHST